MIVFKQMIQLDQRNIALLRLVITGLHWELSLCTMQGTMKHSKTAVTGSIALGSTPMIMSLQLQLVNFLINSKIIALGNKADVLNINPRKREVKKEDAEKFARDNNLIFVGESSALLNQNVQEVMDVLLEKVFTEQSELIKKGKKRREALKISEEELALTNHRCCY